MKAISSNDNVILRLPASADNIHFVFLTFGIMQYCFYDDRFLTQQVKDDHPEKFDENRYLEFREKCLRINDNVEICLTVNEFIFFAKIVDFVSKCFIGDPNSKLKEITNIDFKDSLKFDYESERAYYLKKSTLLFNGFRKNCKNQTIFKAVSRELSWKIDI